MTIQCLCRLDLTSNDLNADIPLDAFMRGMSQKAEQWFNAASEIKPTWFLVSVAHVIISPFYPSANDPYADRYKDKVCEAIRRYFKQHDVIRYVHLDEAWATKGPGGVRPGFDPARREVVVMYAQDHDGALNGMRDIIRPEGCKPYLGKLTLLPGNLCHRYGRRPIPWPGSQLHLH